MELFNLEGIKLSQGDILTNSTGLEFEFTGGKTRLGDYIFECVNDDNRSAKALSCIGQVVFIAEDRKHWVKLVRAVPKAFFTGVNATLFGVLEITPCIFTDKDALQRYLIEEYGAEAEKFDTVEYLYKSYLDEPLKSE